MASVDMLMHENARLTCDLVSNTDHRFAGLEGGCVMCGKMKSSDVLDMWSIDTAVFCSA